MSRVIVWMHSDVRRDVKGVYGTRIKFTPPVFICTNEIWYYSWIIEKMLITEHLSARVCVSFKTGGSEMLPDHLEIWDMRMMGKVLLLLGSVNHFGLMVTLRRKARHPTLSAVIFLKIS